MVSAFDSESMDAIESGRDELTAELRREGLDPDPVLLASLFRPVLPEAVPEVAEEDELGANWVRVSGVRVRYVEGIDEIRVVIEGPLPAAVVAALTDDLCRKLARLHGAPFEALPLPTSPP